jgi:DNA-binding NarL/FixJ family response regulator
LLIADNEATRLGIRMALGDEFEVCAEAGDASQAIREALRRQPDICIISAELAGGGVNAVRGVCRAAPHAGVIVLTSTTDVEAMLEFVRAGAVGYVPASIDHQPLRRVAAAVLEGEAAVPRAMVLELARELRDVSRAGDDGLTPREAQVLGMLRRGQSTGAIAERLEISPVTVRRHISTLVQKRGVDGRDALAA